MSTDNLQTAGLIVLAFIVLGLTVSCTGVLNTASSNVFSTATSEKRSDEQEQPQSSHASPEEVHKLAEYDHNENNHIDDSELLDLVDSWIAEDIRKHLLFLAIDYWSNEKALLPADELSPGDMNDIPPVSPNNVSATVEADFVKLSWEGPSAKSAGQPKHHIVYRKVAGSDKWNSIAKVKTTGETIEWHAYTYKDFSVKSGKNYKYGVTVVDRFGNESKRSTTGIVPIPK